MPPFPPDSKRSPARWWARCCRRLRVRAIIALDDDPQRRQELVAQLGPLRGQEDPRTRDLETPALGEAEAGLELVDSHGQGSSVSRIQPWGRVIALAVVALGGAVVTGGWLVHSASLSTSGGQVVTGIDETVEMDGVETGDVHDHARQLQAVIGWLGLDRVDVVVRDATIHVTGEVPTNLDRVSVLEVVGQLPGDVEVDLAQLTIAAPAGGNFPPPPPGAPLPPTQDQLDALQFDLDAALSEYVLRFEPGSSVLDDDQLEFLSTKIVNVLTAHGNLPVAIAVQDDLAVGDASPASLRSERATYVRDFLVARGLPSFSIQIATSTGRAGNDLRGGAVTLEVLAPPTGFGPPPGG